jgi:hypothetical protein
VSDFKRRLLEMFPAEMLEYVCAQARGEYLKGINKGIGVHSLNFLIKPFMHHDTVLCMRTRSTV